MFSNLTPYSISDHQISPSKESKIMVCVQKSEYGDVEKQLLSKVLNAIQTPIENVNIVLLETQNVSLTQSIRSRTIDTIISFGTKPQQIGFNISVQLYQWAQMEDCKILVCNSLKKVAADKNMKMALWQAIKILSPSS